jgi:hypothetical protein
MVKINKYLIRIGLVVLAIGVIYDIFFAGIPYQDAPDYLVAEYNRHSIIAERILITGSVMTILGLVIRITTRFNRT